MGNRATITIAPFKKTNPCIYVHWNGGRASVEAFCKAAKELGYRSPESDESYALACLTSVISVFFGLDDGLSLHLGKVSDLIGAGDDNGCWVIGKDWQIVEHRDCYGKIDNDPFWSKLEYDVDELATDIVSEVREAAQAVADLRRVRRVERAA